MKTSKQIRSRKLEQLVIEFGTIEAVAEAAGTAPQYLSQIKNKVPSASGTPRGIGDALARKLEKGCNKYEGWMDQDDSNRGDGSAEKTGDASGQHFHSKVQLSPSAARLIREIIWKEEHGSSSPQIIEALTKILHVATPTATNITEQQRISRLIDDD